MLLLCLQLALAAIVVPAAVGAPSDPQPLWQAFPLDNGRQRPSRPAHAATARPQARTAARAPKPATDVGWPLYAVSTVAALAAFAIVTTYLVRVLRRAPGSRDETSSVSGLRSPPQPQLPTLPRRPMRRTDRPAPSAPAASVKTAAAASDGATALKLKQLAAHDEAERDDDLLKAKLAATPPATAQSKPRVPETKVVALPVAASASPRRSPHAQATAPARAPAATTAPPMAASTAAPVPVQRPARRSEGKIVLWRGYVSSEFLAILCAADGSQSVVQRSGTFRWRKADPPPRDVPRIADAHAALVAQLRSDGWVVSEDGEHWYDLSFRPRTKGDT